MLLWSTLGSILIHFVGREDQPFDPTYHRQQQGPSAPVSKHTWGGVQQAHAAYPWGRCTACRTEQHRSSRYLSLTLWLVGDKGCQKNARPAPQSISPLKDFDLFSQCIPSLQSGGQAQVHYANPTAGSASRSINWPPSLESFLLVKDRNHAHDQPASRFRAHVVMKTAQRH